MVVTPALQRKISKWKIYTSKQKENPDVCPVCYLFSSNRCYCIEKLAQEILVSLTSQTFGR